jgi:hypothetical protein
MRMRAGVQPKMSHAGPQARSWETSRQLLRIWSHAAPTSELIAVTLRMQVELQTLNLVVAGSNPAGSKSGGP